MNYREAGVDIEAGESFVRAISPLAKATSIPGVLGGLGGFGAMFDPKAAGLHDPLLCAATDGVGTKLRVAIEAACYTTIGIDLVAMCVNDLIVHGARPLFFLDYYATGKLTHDVAVAIVRGITDGCLQAGCALVGGETAEMAGLYHGDDFDLAGFAVGAVERGRQLPAGVAKGDVLIGLPSSGVHSNGFSLVRRIVAALPWATQFDAIRTLADCFLTPTRIYVSDILRLCQEERLHALAHITGGGLIGNIPRVIPDGLTVRIDQPWPVPAEFGWLRDHGQIGPADMLETFNCGIGMVMVVPESEVSAVLGTTDGAIIGEVVSGHQPVIRLPDDEWWS